MEQNEMVLKITRRSKNCSIKLAKKDNEICLI